MERRIGEIFEFGGEWYQCVKSDGTCNGCVGEFQPYSLCDGFGECTGKIFKKLEKVGEPVTKRGRTFQCLKSPEAGCMKCVFLEDRHRQVCDKDHYIDGPCPNWEIWVEIKQYEDMKDNRTIDQHFAECGQTINEVERKCYTENKSTQTKDMEEKEPKLKEFDLNLAKQGKPVCTRDGRKARIICFDRNDLYPIVALIECEDGKEMIGAYSKEGQTEIYEIKGTDLMMLPEKKEGWIKVKKDVNLYATKEEADRKMIGNTDYISAKVEWEE